MRGFSSITYTLAALWFLGCGAPQQAAPPPERSKVEESEEATAIIRGSFDAMGGLERLRLSGGEVKIVATATAGGASVPVEVTLGGPERYRIDYVGTEISYVHDSGKCRKISYGISSRCTSAESRWTVPARILSALTFPAADAAKLRSTFRMREDETIEGKACVVPEVRPKNSNLKIRVAYDKATNLPVRASWYYKDEQGNKEHWSVTYGDWRESKKMMVPFRRTVRRGNNVVWEEAASSVDFDAFDERAFLAPIPPTTDQPLPYKFPARQFVKKTVDGQEVEFLAPRATLGGAAPQDGALLQEGACEAIRIVHRGPLSKAKEHFENLKGGAMSEGRKLEGEPGIILLEEPDGPDSPALMIIYSKLAPQSVSVDISI